MEDLKALHAELVELSNDNQRRADKYDDGAGGGELHCYLGGKAFAYQVAADLLEKLIK